MQCTPKSRVDDQFRQRSARKKTRVAENEIEEQVEGWDSGMRVRDAGAARRPISLLNLLDSRSKERGKQKVM